MEWIDFAPLFRGKNQEWLVSECPMLVLLALSKGGLRPMVELAMWSPPSKGQGPGLAGATDPDSVPHHHHSPFPSAHFQDSLCVVAPGRFLGSRFWNVRFSACTGYSRLCPKQGFVGV